jgi:deoxyguanosine kinase
MMSAHSFVAFEGVIGVGKTTAARLLQRSFSAECIYEVVEENPFLTDFYQDQAKYAFQTQIFFLLSRFRQMQVAAPPILARANLLSDYLLAKDCIFARLTLNRDELEMHSRLYPLLASGLPQPDLVVYLYADSDVLMERIANRDRPFERSMSRQYIERLRDAYEEYFRTFADVPLLRIDTNAMDFAGNPLHLREVGERIRTRLGLGTFQDSLL